MGRKSADADKLGALDKQLKGMFRALQLRPTPDRIRSVVDQLDEGAASDVLKKSG